MKRAWGSKALCLSLALWMVNCGDHKENIPPPVTSAKPPLPSNATPEEIALNQGIVGLIKGGSSTGSPFASVFGGTEDTLGGLAGDRPGEADGGYGMGLRGTGIGGGGTGEGTIGLGNDNTIGKGGGGYGDEGKMGKKAGLYAMKGPADPKKESTPQAPIETWQRAKATANVSRLMVGDKEALPLEEMHVSVKVDGFRARVLLDLYYPNNTGRTVEGNFSLKLPEDATPFFLAFGGATYQTTNGAPRISAETARTMGFLPDEILQNREKSWSNPKVARMVPKEEAAYAYAETVRAQIDPALAEWAGAGVFNAKLFPLTSGVTHHVVVGYDVDLVQAGSDLELKVELPEGVETLNVDLSVVALPGVEVKTTPEMKSTSYAGRKFYHLEKPKKEIIIRQVKAGAQVLAGSDVQTGSYFASRVTPELAANQNKTSSQAIFLVDTSLSANPDQFNVWLKLLKAILEENRPTLARFSVLFFNVETFAWKPGFTDNTQANVDALLTFANTLSLEGATDLDAAIRQAAALEGDIFLLSDGASTWGESEAFAISSALQNRTGNFYAYSTGFAGADLNFLQHITREGRGAIFSVVGEAEIKKAATAHQQTPWALLDVSVEGGSDLLIAGRPRALFPGQPLLLVGRGNPKEGAIAKLKVKQGTEEKTIEVSLGTSVSSVLAPRLYGQVATTQLEDLGFSLEEDAKAYARHFRVTGRTTSLLMLETEADYARFGIVPQSDAEKIKATTVADKVAEFFKSVQESLSDPKKAFLTWQKRLASFPRISLKLPADLQSIVEGLPSSAFAVSIPAMSCKNHTQAGLPKDIMDALSSHTLDYDLFNKEAEKRKAQSSCDALKALSSLVEENPGDTVLARDIAYQAIDLKLPGQAYSLFKRVVNQRPYEPQTYHAIAQVLSSLGKADLALTYFELGLRGNWDGRFGDFWAIIGLDYLRFLRASSAKLSPSFAEYAKKRQLELSEDLEVDKADLIVTISWNTDNTDMDLHVLEPSGEECYYGFTETYLGGSLTRDVTQGYGPEMYVMKEATQGKYVVRVHSYATDRNRMSARTKILATVYQKFGSPGETVTRKVITLDDSEQSDDESKLKEIMTLQLTGKPLAPKKLTEEEISDECSDLRDAFYSLLSANRVEPSEEVLDKMDSTYIDRKFMRKWAQRALSITPLNAEKEFKQLLAETTEDMLKEEVDLMREAIYAIFDANNVEVSEAADKKLQDTTDHATVKAWMNAALTATSADKVILGRETTKPEDVEEEIDPSRLEGAIYAILDVKSIELSEAATKKLGEVVQKEDAKLLTSWMRRAPSLTTEAAANAMILSGK